MKVKLTITDTKTVSVGYSSSLQPPKTETYTVAEVDGELTQEATVGFLRALAQSIEGEKRDGGFR